MIASTVRSTPRRRPGKNPARTAIAGNLSHEATAVPFLRDALPLGMLELWLGALDDEAEEGADVIEADFVDEADGFEVDEAADDEELLAFIMHCWFWHEKPLGQQALPSLPHVSKLPPRSVLCNGFEGCRVAFCCVMSQLMGAIVLQS